MAISSNGTVLARLAGGLYNTTLSNSAYSDVIASIKTAADLNSFANDAFARDFAGKTDLQVANTLLTNLGLSSVTGLNNWVAAQLTAAGSAKGAKIVSLLNDFANLTSDATYGAAATAFNNKAAAALALSQKAGSAGGDFNAAAAAEAAEAAAAAAAKAAADAAAKAAAEAAAKAAAEAAVFKDFSFTTGTKDIFNGTANADKLAGVISSDDALNTIDSTDTVFDATKGDGDTLTVTTDDDIDALPSLTNIENLVIKVDATTTTSGATFGLDVSDAKGHKTVSVDVVRTVTGINATAIDGVGDGVTVTTGAKLKTVTIGASDVDNNINVAIQASGSVSAPAALSIDNEGDNVITAAGHINVTASSTGAVTLTAGKSATLTASDAAVVIATANGGSLTVDGANAVSLRAVATGDIEITEGGEGDLTVNSSAGDVEVADTASTDTTVTAYGDITFDGTNTGDMNLTAGGDIVVTATEATDATIVAGGDVDFDGTTGEGALSISAGGDISVTGTEHKNVTLTTTDGAVEVTSTGAGALKVTATDDVTVTADQKNVTVTTTGNVAVTSTGAGALVIDAAGEHTVDAAQVAVTISGIGSSTLDIDASKSLTVSGSGDEAEFDVTDMSALATITATGSQDVTLILDAADRDGDAIKILDKSTGTLTVDLSTAGSVDLRTSDSIDSLILSEDFATETIKLASGQAVAVEHDQGAAATFTIGTASAVAKNTLTLNLDDTKRDANVVDLNGVTVETARTITINASADTGVGGLANPSTITSFNAADAKANVTINAGANGVTLATAFDVGSAGSLTIKSSGAVGVGATAVTAALLDASAATGKVTATELTSSVSVVKTGSAGDALTYTGAGNITVESGAGNDTLQLDNASYADKSVSINMGEGTGDTLVLDDGTVLGKGTTGSVTVSGVETIRVKASTSGATKIDASLLTGQTYALQTGADSTAVKALTLTATVASTATALDFTGLVASTAVSTYFGPTSSSSTSTGSTLAIDANKNTAAMSIKGMTGAMNSITGSAASGDTLVGGAKDDTFTYSNSNLLFANKALLDSIDGGAGNDTLTVTTGTIAATDSFAGLTSIEKISSGSASLSFGVSAETAGLKSFTSTGTGTLSVSTAAYTTLGTTVSVTGASKATVTTGAASDAITLSDVALADSVVTAGAGDDTITVNSLLAVSVNGGTGNDTFKFAIDLAGKAPTKTSASFEDADTTVVGGTGTDTLIFSTTTDEEGDDEITIDETGTGFSNVSSVEVLKVGSATSSVISITLEGNAEDAGIRTVDISADTDTDGANQIILTDYVADVTVVGGAGNDSISLGDVGTAHISAGGGNDTIDLAANLGTNSLTDTIIFASSAEDNGTDSISGFELAGIATDGDIIDVSAFISGAAIIGNAVGSDSITPVLEGSTNDVQLNGRIAVVDDSGSGNLADAADILATINLTDSEFNWTAAGKAVLFVYGGTDTTIWYIDSSLAGSASTVSVDDIKLVGTLALIDGTDLIASNIVS